MDIDWLCELARACYGRGYADGWQGCGERANTLLEEFKAGLLATMNGEDTEPYSWEDAEHAEVMHAADTLRAGAAIEGFARSFRDWCDGGFKGLPK